MRLPSNGVRTKPAPLGFGTVENGSYIVDKVPFAFLVSEKSPWRCSSVGTLETLVPGLPSRRPSYAPKKKSFLAFQIGPPSVPPNWLRWKRVRLSRARLLAQE